MSNTSLYKVYGRIKGCTSSVTHPDYRFYGARGVRVCQEWMDSFENFQEWAISNGYEKGLTLDRIDTHGDYCPENCRWITIQEQQRNRRDNHLITIGNETKCLSEWCEIYNKNYATVLSRKESGLTWEDAFSMKVGITRKDNKSGYPGIFLRKNGKWEASVSENGRKVYLGEFNSKEEAISCRESYKKRCSTYRKNGCYFVEEGAK